MADPQRSRTFLRTLVSFGRSLENHQDLAALLQRAVVLAAQPLHWPTPRSCDTGLTMVTSLSRQGLVGSRALSG